MLEFEWSEEKNELLKNTRDVSFEELVQAYASGAFYKIRPHPDVDKYPRQSLLIISIRGYIHCAPFVWKGSRVVFLKTLYKSRVFNNLYKSSK